MTFLMSSGEATSGPYFYSTHQYAYITNKYTFTTADNTLTGPDALPSSVDLHSLSPDDSLVLAFLVDPIISNSTMPYPVIKCPSANHMFVNNIDPASILKSVTTPPYTHTIRVSLESLQNCDGPNGGCTSAEIKVGLIFSNLRTTTTTSTTPIPTTSCPKTTCPTIPCPTVTSPTTTCPTATCPTVACPTVTCPPVTSPITTTPTTTTPTACPTITCSTVTSQTTTSSNRTNTTMEPSASSYSTSSSSTPQSTSQPEGPTSAGLIAAVIIAVIEFLALCGVLLFCLWKHRQKKNKPQPSEELSSIPKSERRTKINWKPSFPRRKKVNQSVVHYNPSNGDPDDIYSDTMVGPGDAPEDPPYTSVNKAPPTATKPRPIRAAVPLKVVPNAAPVYADPEELYAKVNHKAAKPIRVTAVPPRSIPNAAPVHAEPEELYSEVDHTAAKPIRAVVPPKIIPNAAPVHADPEELYAEVDHEAAGVSASANNDIYG